MKTEIILKANQSDIVEILLQEVRTDLQTKADALTVHINDSLKALKKDKDLFEEELKQIMLDSIPQRLHDIVNLMGSELKSRYPRRISLITGDNAFITPIGSNNNQRTSSMINLIDYIQFYTGNRRDNVEVHSPNMTHVSVIMDLVVQNNSDSKAYAEGLDIAITYELPINKHNYSFNIESVLNQFIQKGSFSKLNSDEKSICKQLKTVFGELLFKGLLGFKAQWVVISNLAKEHAKLSQSIWDVDNRPGKFKAQFTKASLQKSNEGREILKVIDELKEANYQTLLTS